MCHITPADDADVRLLVILSRSPPPPPPPPPLSVICMGGVTKPEIDRRSKAEILLLKLVLQRGRHLTELGSKISVRNQDLNQR